MSKDSWSKAKIAAFAILVTAIILGGLRSVGIVI